ncbi:M48 family metalloprotease [Acidimicrobiaceae bacterium USS-CC1]|uniref:M48 family metalloprotease n=1 Tax=Acidiferrimicrobium australe TaxID=2664430 RepID=A0ABW9QVW8_9ACTN|nr:M48 family metalloprotease [Acidiferrimicrobium australe]
MVRDPPEVVVTVVLVVVVVVLVALAMGAILAFNGLVRRRNRTREAWAEIEVELERRHDLVPNLVETVRGYASHERGTFEAVTAARAAAVSAGASGDPSTIAPAEDQLGRSLRSLFAVAERYPDLRAVEAFDQLQEQLTATEDKIEFSRRYYNTSARDYDNALQSFPRNLLAEAFGFRPATYFEAPPGDEAAPRVSFDGGGPGGAQPRSPTGITPPQVYVVDDPSPNAFATGVGPRRAAVTVTTGLLALMDREELEGVLAHEMSHIRNYDVRLLLVVSTLIGMAGLLASVVWRTVIVVRPRGRDAEEVVAAMALAGLLLAAVAVVVGPLIRLALSRRREQLADVSAVELTRNPAGLIGALRKLERNDRPMEHVNHATAAMCIDDPLQHHEGWFHRLFDTHPPIRERIAVLEGILEAHTV